MSLATFFRRCHTYLDYHERILASGPGCDCEPEGHICGWPRYKRETEYFHRALHGMEDLYATGAGADGADHRQRPANQQQYLAGSLCPLLSLRRAVESLSGKTLVTAGGRQVATDLVQRAEVLALLDAVRNNQAPVSPSGMQDAASPEGGQK